MDPMQSEINSSAITDRVNPEVQNIMGSLPSDRNGPDPSTSLTEDGVDNASKSRNTKLTKKDSRSACDLREDTGFTPYE